MAEQAGGGESSGESGIRAGIAQMLIGCFCFTGMALCAR